MEMLRPLHQGISVPDAEAAAAWYQEIFHFELLYREHAAALNCNIIFLRLGTFELEIFQYLGDDGKPLPEERRAPNEDIKTCGTKHVAYQVEDLDAMYEYLLEKQVDVVLPPFAMNQDQVMFLRDNSGILIELIQR